MVSFGAEIADREIEPLLDLPVGLFGEADRAAWRRLHTRGDIDAIAHEIAVGRCHTN